jgi:hypothetical protein
LSARTDQDLFIRLIAKKVVPWLSDRILHKFKVSSHLQISKKYSLSDQMAFGDPTVNHEKFHNKLGQTKEPGHEEGGLMNWKDEHFSTASKPLSTWPF